MFHHSTALVGQVEIDAVPLFIAGSIWELGCSGYEVTIAEPSTIMFSRERKGV